MAGGPISGANIYGLTIRESATDGSDFTNPDADYRRLFLGEDGQLHVKDSAGAVTDIGAAGDVATDAIFDAKGDLPVGTGANTAAKLTVGANGTRPEAASGESTGIKWSYPPGYEFDYAEITTADISITATTDATADTVVTGNAVTYDGSTTVEILAFFPKLNPSGTSTLVPCLYDGSSSVGRFTEFTVGAAYYGPLSLCYRITPSSGSHTYGVRFFTSAGTAHIYSGNGTGTAIVPSSIRITKA